MTDISGKEIIIFEGMDQPNHLEHLTCRAAEAILRKTEPYILATYLAEYDPSLGQEEIRSILRDNTFKEDHKWAYVAWGRLLAEAGIYDEAWKLYYRALEEDKNFDVAINNLGIMYNNGWGLPSDHVMAKVYFEEASRNGYETARFNLAKLMHQNGDQKGIEIFEDLAKKNHGKALAYLGVTYPDIEYLKRAAHLGEKIGQNYLGDFYMRGKHGLPVDLEIARYWLRKGAEGAIAFAEL